MTACAVLHVSSLLGGGVDRHLRDIARSVPRRHYAWHTGERADVLEILGEKRFFPLDGAALERDSAPLSRWLRERGVGIVHVHSVSRPVRLRAEWATRSLGLRCITTLHDILFLRQDAFDPRMTRSADPRWLAETTPFLQQSAALIAPSDYLADLAWRQLDGTHVDVVPNGTDAAANRGRRLEARPEFARRAPRHVVGVLGAIGPHKGREVLEALATRLAGSDIAIVVIGYLDSQVLPGWHGDHLFVHGTYDDADVAALFAAYGVEIALFASRVPESFSYALSDAWGAGLPVLVPPEGALGERVGRHGGGWVLPEGAGAEDIDRFVRRLFSSEGSEELARVKSQLALPDPARVPSLEAMARSLDALYDRFGIDTPEALDPASAPAQELLATNLDASLFRAELARLADEMVQMRTAFEGTLAFEREQARKQTEESGKWVAKLETDVADLRNGLAREFDARTKAEREIGEMHGDLARAEAELAELRPVKRAFDRLPGRIRAWLLKRANARS